MDLNFTFTVVLQRQVWIAVHCGIICVVKSLESTCAHTWCETTIIGCTVLDRHDEPFMLFTELMQTAC